jgi:hypothetical protein
MIFNDNEIIYIYGIIHFLACVLLNSATGNDDYEKWIMAIGMAAL